MTKATIIPSLTNNPPSRANPAAFPTDGDSFLNDLPDVVSGVNTVATELNTWNSDISELQYSAGLSATNASNSKDTSLGNARLAASWFLSEWVSGTTYPAGQIVYSNVDGREYRRITAGAGTTDPSSDPTNWEPLGWEYITNYPDIRPTLDLNFAGSQTVDPRITFTRNSTATYFDKFGVMQTAGVNQPRIDFDPVTGECKGLLIEEQRTNLYASDAQNAGTWNLNNTYIIPNITTAPDGTMTAHKMCETLSTSSVFDVYTQPVTVSAGNTYTVSIYLKAAERSELFFRIETGSNIWSYNIPTVNLTSKSYTPSNYNQANSRCVITDVGNGWRRVEASITVPSGATVLFLRLQTTVNSNNTYVGIPGNGMYFWGLQVELGNFATSYTPVSRTFASRASSATYFDSTGILRTAGTNQARYAYGYDSASGKWVSQGLVLESAATNLLFESNCISPGSNWQEFNTAVITKNYSLAPDNTISASRITTTTPGTVRVATNGTLTNGVYYAASIWLKSNTSSNYTLTLQIGDQNVKDIVITPTWQRFEGFGTPNVTGYNFIDLEAIQAGADISVWGAQLETGYVATSYIPTYGSAATRSADVSSSAATTRVKDSAQIIGTNFTSWYRQDEGTLYADVSSYQGSVFQRVLTIHDGSSNNQIWLTSTDAESFAGYVGGAFQWQIALSSAVGRIAGAYKTNDIAVSKNGSSVSTDTSARLPVLDRIRIGASWNGDSPVNGCIRRIAYYPKRLPDATLQAITQP